MPGIALELRLLRWDLQVEAFRLQSLSARTHGLPRQQVGHRRELYRAELQEQAGGLPSPAPRCGPDLEEDPGTSSTCWQTL